MTVAGILAQATPIVCAAPVTATVSLAPVADFAELLDNCTGSAAITGFNQGDQPAAPRATRFVDGTIFGRFVEIDRAADAAPEEDNAPVADRDGKSDPGKEIADSPRADQMPLLSDAVAKLAPRAILEQQSPTLISDLATAPSAAALVSAVRLQVPPNESGKVIQAGLRLPPAVANAGVSVAGSRAGSADDVSIEDARRPSRPSTVTARAEQLEQFGALNMWVAATEAGIQVGARLSGLREGGDEEELLLHGIRAAAKEAGGTLIGVRLNGVARPILAKGA